MTAKTTLLTAGLATTLGLGLVLAPAASASGGGGVHASGACAHAGSWTLKAKHDDGAIEVEAEVDTNHAGQRFAWTLRDNGTRVRSGSATTTRPSGSFTIERRIANRAGVDHVVFRATRAGNTCQGSVNV